VGLITLSASPPAWSGGVLLREFGTPDVGDAPLDVQGGPLRGRLVGRYDPNALHFIALSFIWRFGG
jgi:hypothetical protein